MYIETYLTGKILIFHHICRKYKYLTPSYVVIYSFFFFFAKCSHSLKVVLESHKYAHNIVN